MSNNNTSVLTKIANDYNSKRARTYVPEVNALITFLQKFPAHVDPISQEKTSNIFCKGIGSWLVDDTEIDELFRLLEVCYTCNHITHFAEKQGAESGIMIDFDIDHNSNTQIISIDVIKEISCIVIEIIQDSILQKDSLGTGTYLGILKSDKPRKKEKKRNDSDNDSAVYRDGFHLIFPSIKISKSHKRSILLTINTNDDIKKIITDECARYNAELVSDNYVDLESASVPVHFIGSCKDSNGKVPDTLYTCKLTKRSRWNCVDVNISTFTGSIVRDFSLNYDGVKIQKSVYTPSSIMLHTNIAPENNDVKDQLALLFEQDINAEMIYKMSMALPDRYTEEYSLWSRIIFALSCASADYFAIAVAFSSRCPAKFNINDLQRRWTDMRMRDRNPKGVYYINKQLRETNIVAYNEVINGSVVHLLMREVWDDLSCGFIGENVIVKTIAMLLPEKYVTTQHSNEHDVAWYEFINKDDEHESGAIYKYRKTNSNGLLSLRNYIANNYVEAIGRTLVESMKSAVDNAETDLQRKAIKRRFDAMCKSFNALKSFKNHSGIISGLSYKFMDSNFANKVDMCENILGVGNGVLVLGKRPRLIQGKHKYPITKYTQTCYFDYDPDNEDIKKIEGIYREIFLDNEQESFEFIMCWLAASIDFRKWPEILLLGHGTGANAKTMIVEMQKSALGEGFVKSHSGNLLTQPLGRAEQSNTAMITMKYARMNVYDELGDGAILHDINIKTIVGNVFSGAEKFEKQQTFMIRGCHIAFTNHVVRILSEDYGSRRRIAKFSFKREFLYPNHPIKPYDPNNPLHRKADKSIKDEYIKTERAREAILSVLVKWYCILHTKYGGNILNVPHHQINAETEDFLNCQDPLNNWIAENVVKTSEPSLEVPISSFVDAYISWYDKHLARQTGISLKRREVNNKFIYNSKLKDIANIKTTNEYSVVVGYRPLLLGQDLLAGESFIAQSKKNRVFPEHISVDHRMKLADYIAMHAQSDNNESHQASASSK